MFLEVISELIQLWIPNFKALKKDYYRSGYDRGHLVPAADMNFDSTAMSECFLFTNVTPQTPTFNRGIWKKLESLTRSLRVEKDSLVIITGTIFKDTTQHFTTLSGGIPVPEFYYKEYYLMWKNLGLLVLLYQTTLVAKKEGFL